MLRKLLLSDSSISLLLHGLKAVVALAINWMVLAQFPSADYVTWAVSSSILVVATASDLGIGQYATTQLIHATPDRRAAIVRDSLVALAPLALGAVAFVYLALGSQPAVYKAAMATFIGLRVLSIPFGAVLNAVNQFKLRKAIEVGVYLASAVLIAWVAYAGKPVLWALLTLNAFFMVGGFVTILLAARYFDIPALWANLPGCARLGRVYRSSVPFMVNNLTGLLTYGGFIWISSFFLGVNDIAKIAVLHTFVLMNLYQLYDVFLKARQADLIESRIAARARRINVFVMAGVPMVFLGLGGEVFQLLTDDIQFSRLDVFLFSLFMSLELGFLLIQSLAQVRWDLSKSLGLYSITRLLCQAAALVTFILLPAGVGLTEYIALFAATSAVGFFLVFRHLDSQLQRKVH